MEEAEDVEVGAEGAFEHILVFDVEEGSGGCG